MDPQPPCCWSYGHGFVSGEPAPPPPYCAECAPCPAIESFGGQINHFYGFTPAPATSAPLACAPAPPPAPAGCFTVCTDPYCSGSNAPIPSYGGPYWTPPETLAAPSAPAVRNGPPDIPGATILHPTGPYLTMLVVAKGTKLWRMGVLRGFPMKLQSIETGTSVRSLIQRLGGDENHKVTEIYERGDGTFGKGLTVRFKHVYAKKTLAEVGWTKERGGERVAPLMVVLLKDKEGGPVQNE